MTILYTGSCNIDTNLNMSVMMYLGFEVFKSMVMKSSPLKVNRSFGGTYRLHLHGRRIRYQNGSRWQAEPAFTLASCSAYSSTLKMGAICSSELLVDFQWATRHYIPEDNTLHDVCSFSKDFFLNIVFIISTVTCWSLWQQSHMY
jgi:hypothetical protein